MKKRAAFFATFILLIAGAAECRAQTAIGTWADFQSFFQGTDTVAGMTGDITSTNNFAIIWGSYDKTLDGGGFTLSGNGTTSNAFVPPSNVTVQDANVTIGNVTITGFTRSAISNNYQGTTGVPVQYTSFMTIGPGVVFDGNYNSNDGGGAIWNEFEVQVASGTVFKNNKSIFG
ncbi:MAG: hypothetical protein LBI01_04445, partial [Elusimicrobium sp.]|nr:hypothetical protein [Elusimicrobium sp.]